MSDAAYRNVDQAFLRNQVKVSQAQIACALERFWLRHGHYPERLEELSPDWLKSLPRDLFSGAPMIYQRTDPGHYHLRSVGLNRKDDGVKVDPLVPKISEADIVWPFAPRPDLEVQPEERTR